MKRFLITQSLLSSWIYSYKYDDGFKDFKETLERKSVKQTKQMLDGIRFENCLNAVLNGSEIGITHELYKPIMELYPTLIGSQQQVRLSKNVSVKGINFVLYGVLDFLKAGIIYDTKYSKTYKVGKYLDSPQHPMYFALVPEAREFQYKTCDGNWIYTETYRPDETEPIERIIDQFMEFLDRLNLVNIYCEHWISKY